MLVRASARTRRWLWPALACAVVAAAVASPAAQAAGHRTPRCHGKAATIVVRGRTGRGTNGSDVIVVTRRAGARVDARKGNDFVCGGRGRDRLNGGLGQDTLIGGPGADRLTGGPGHDRFTKRRGDRISDRSAGDIVNGHRQGNIIKARRGTVQASAAKVSAVSGDPAGRQTVTLAKGAAAPRVGGILVVPIGGRAPRGVLGRVTAVKRARGGGHMVTLRPASLDDAYSTFDVTRSGTLARLARPLKTTQRRLKSGLTARCTGQFGSRELKFDLDMSELHFTGDFQAGAGYLRLQLYGTVKVAMTFAVTGKGTCKLTSDNALFIPVAGAFGVSLAPTASFTIDGRLGGKWEWKPRMSYGFMASKLYGFDDLTTFNGGTTASYPDLDGTATAFVGLELEGSVGGRVGIGGNLGPALEFNGHAGDTSDPQHRNGCLSLYAKFQAQLTATARVFFTDFTFSLKPWFLNRVKLFDTCAPAAPTPTHSPAPPPPYTGSGGGGWGDDPGPPAPGEPVKSAGSRLSVSRYHVCGIKLDRTVWCWGDNVDGQLGTGSTFTERLPAHVAGLTDAVDVSVADLNIVGGYHGAQYTETGVSCALTAASAIYCWGSGDGDTVPAVDDEPVLTPKPVTGIPDPVDIDVQAGYGCAVTAAGTLWCWGRFPGERDAVDRFRTPSQVAGLSGVARVATDPSNACVLKADRTVWCVGSNYWGQLGNGNTQDSETFMRVPGIADATALRLHDDTACAVRTGGTVWCWGHDQDRSYPGTGDPRRLTPTQIAGISGADDVGIGYDHSCAHGTDGSVRCWGANAAGQLGDGSGHDSPDPVLAAPAGSTAALASAAYDNCLLTRDGGAACWGSDYYGQLGDGGDGVVYAPTRVLGFP